MSTSTAPSAETIWTMDVPQAGGDFTPCPAGNFPGRICGLFDIGHHPEEKTDEKTKAKKMVDTHKLVIVLELAKKQANGQPFTMGLKLTWSMHEKSNFFDLVVGITGTKLTPGQQYNPLTLLGTPVSVNVVQKPGKDAGKSYHNVDKISQWMEGMPQPAWAYEPVAWSIRETGRPFPEFGWLPLVYGKSIKTLAGESVEARGFSPGQQVTTNPPAPAPTPGVSVIRKDFGDYTPAVGILMQKYGISPGYSRDDLSLLRGQVAIPDADFALIDDEATPF